METAAGKEPEASFFFFFFEPEASKHCMYLEKLSSLWKWTVTV